MKESPAQAADILAHGFDDYHQRYRAVTRRARDRFERREWQGVRRDTVERLNLYERCVGETLGSLRDQVGERIVDPALLTRVKQAYTEVILGRHDFELAQTFFNSVIRRLHGTVGVDPGVEFVADQVDEPAPDDAVRPWRDKLKEEEASAPGG